MNKSKFLVMYISSILLGNVMLYIIDSIGNANGKTPWTLQNYIIFNACIFALGIFASILAENEKVNRFVQKHLSNFLLK